MSQSPSNTVVNLASANAEQHVTSASYYERIIITNETTGDVYVRTDGSAVAETTGNFGAIVLPGAWRMVGNDQPRQPLITTKAGSTAQGTLNVLASGSPTYVSLMGTATGNVGVEFV